MSVATTLKPGQKLTETDKKSIILAHAQGETQTSIAKRFNVSIVHVGRICQGVKEARKKSLEDWRESLDGQSFTAIQRSLKDKAEPHRAANTGLSWLKGVGVLAGDGVNVTINQVLAQIPQEWREEYVITPESNTTTPCGELPTPGAVSDKSS